MLISIFYCNDESIDILLNITNPLMNHLARGQNNRVLVLCNLWQQSRGQKVSNVPLAGPQRRFSSLTIRSQYGVNNKCLSHPASNHPFLKSKYRQITMTANGYPVNQSGLSNDEDDQDDQYARAIRDLNSLQSNNQVLALAKYKKPETILPLFRRQLLLAGIQVDQLNRLNVIHISGTKGKGSTCAFLEKILNESQPNKLKVGSYTSPHLISVTERIRIDAKPIDKALFSKHFRQVYDKLKLATQRENITMPSYFAFLTILAFHVFLEEQVDCAVVEVGMGGEYDPTNVVEKPLACAITTLDLDHTNILGRTISSIAWTKAGIIKPGAPMFTIAHEQEEATQMIEKRAREKQSPVYFCKPLKVDNAVPLSLGIRGPAQYINASIACQLASYYFAKCARKNALELEITVICNNSGQSQRLELKTDIEKLPQFFRAGLVNCQLPGRCQIVKCRDVTYFLDGAHTEKSMNNCLEWFVDASTSLDELTRKILMVNVIGERDKFQVLRPLIRYNRFERVMFSTNRIQSSSDELSTSETFVRLQDQNFEKGLDNAKNNARVWHDLTTQYSDNNHDDDYFTSLKTSTHASIMDCVNLIDNLVTVPEEQTRRPLHVLATGSLHFVGAILETLALCYPDPSAKTK